jgi:hypothetical protein
MRLFSFYPQASDVGKAHSVQHTHVSFNLTIKTVKNAFAVTVDITISWG